MFCNESTQVGRKMHAHPLYHFVKVKPRSAPLAAVEDLDKETENGYAIPRDNITPGSQVRYSDGHRTRSQNADSGP